MAKDEKPIYTGIIEKDEAGNYFCGEYLLDYRQVETKFQLGDKISIKSIIENPSDKSYAKYPKKSKEFSLADKKKFLK
ncbi:hypothetical protein HYN59_05985 [Flavobacterium album]|uniref:Uncharacterized protein n=1 Tax=Flavobacterium album TaxID=2175091 RepID=A0A2S1QW98_9FLAO|nr:hypothetical protein [Flavobacterium album]AWH84697.1 hypothetical protein HYN59_05985 [Flavobacterium album]